MTCIIVQKNEVIQNVYGRIEYNENLMQYVFLGENKGQKLVSEFTQNISFYDSELKKYCYSDYKEYGEYTKKFAESKSTVYANFRTTYHGSKKTCFDLPSFPELEKEYPGYTGKTPFHLYLEKMDDGFYSSSDYYLGAHANSITSIREGTSSSHKKED